MTKHDKFVIIDGFLTLLIIIGILILHILGYQF